jgi:hypothetical protein
MHNTFQQYKCWILVYQLEKEEVYICFCCIIFSDYRSCLFLVRYIRRQLCDRDSDCGIDDFEGRYDGSSGSQVDKEPLSLSTIWGPPHHNDKSGVNNFSSGAVGINLNEAPHVNKDSAPL